MTETIDLSRFRSGKGRVFAGRDRGSVIRNKVSLESIDEAGNEVTISIPDDVIVVNTSFFLGLFGDSVRRLGASEFRQRYTFIGPIPSEVITDGIDQAMREQSPLS